MNEGEPSMIRRNFSKALLALTATVAMALPGVAAARGDLVVVAGATGRTGQLVVEQLVARKYRVRALVRDAAKAKAELPAGVEAVVADVRDPLSLVPAMKGARYVISTIGASGGPKADPENGPQQIDFRGVENLANAARGAGVKHFVLVSSAAVTKAADYPMAFMRPILAAKAQGEEALRNSTVRYTIVRPGGLVDEPGGKFAVQFSQGDKTAGRIPRADVALVCVEALGRRTAQGKTFEILSGPGPVVERRWAQDFAALAWDAR
jgi:uncharacterized protein YbjT (DUF2867 family)